jgi:hypothetical protein
MRRVFFTFLSAAAVCAFASATPSLAGTGNAAAAAAATAAPAPAPTSAPGTSNGNDARAQADQAQIHPMMANQYPDWTPRGVAEGEVYPSRQTYGRGYGYNYSSLDAATALVTDSFDASGALLAAPFDAAAAFAMPGFDAGQTTVAASPRAVRTSARCHVRQDFYGFDGRYTSVCRF